jgi:hypothetical protein
METQVGGCNFQLGSVVAITIGCVLFLPTSVHAQVGSGAKVQMQEMDKRELQLSELSKGNPGRTDSRRAQAIKDQVNEDFHRILKLHNDIVRVIAGNDSLQYQFISEATSEINKRAVRLQATLALGIREQPEPNRDHTSEVQDLQIKDNLIKLCRKIELFIKNPVIDIPGTVNAQQLDSARRDLQSVIELSGSLRKDAQRQKKRH